MIARVGAIVLAAGASTRMGRPKQLLAIDGQSLIRRAVNAANQAGCDPVCIVTGGSAELVAAELSELPVHLLYNSNWEKGMGTSIRAGIATLESHPVDGALVLVCDQPMLSASVLSHLLGQWVASGRPLAASVYGPIIGPPCIFARSTWPMLLLLPDDQGARQVLRDDPDRVCRVDWPGGEIDLDTPADVAAFQARRTAL